MVVAATNTTQPGASLPSNVDSSVQSPWSSRVLGARSTPQRLLFPDSDPQPCRRSFAAAADSISAPVYCAKGTSPGAVLDQKTLDQRWAAVVERLETLPLKEHEMFDVLESGLLQTATGSRLRGLFVEALMRSIQPKGDLTTRQLREIVEVICHLPPVCWADAFGERLNFDQGTQSESVAGFIQSQLVSSRLHRDDKIANGELLTDAQWRDFKSAVRESRSSIRPWRESRLNSTLMKLEDGLHVRPSPQEARLFLGEFLQRLDEAGIQERFPDRHKRKLHQIWQSIEVKTDQQAISTASAHSMVQGLVNQTNSALNMLGSLSTHDLARAFYRGADSAVQFAGGIKAAFDFVFSASPKTSVKTEQPAGEVDAGELCLLTTLQEIERKGTFYDDVVNSGPRVPDGIAGKLLYTLNALDTVGITVIAEKVRSLLPAPSSVQTGHFTSPVTVRATVPVPQEVMFSRTNMLEKLEVLAGQIDDLLAQSAHVLTGWHPVEAGLLSDPRSLLAILKQQVNKLGVRTPLRNIPSSSYGALGNPYATTEDLTAKPVTAQDTSSNSVLEALLASLGSWLHASTHSLATMGLVALNSAAGIVQQHPRATATVTLAAIHALISEFYSQWFPEDVRAPTADVHFAQEMDPPLHNTIVHDVASLLDKTPQVVFAVKERMAASIFDDPHQDPQFVADVARLLEQPVPGILEQTYFELVDKTIAQDLDASVRLHSLPAPAILDRSQRRKRAAEWTLESITRADGADRNLKNDVVTLLSSGQYSFLSIPPGTLIHSPVELFRQTLNDPAVLGFFNAQGLSLTTLRIQQDSISGSITRDGVTTTQTFTLWDNSGWWQVCARVLAARAILDPEDIGLPYLSCESSDIPLEVMLQFYGVTPPTSADEAKNLASELESKGWPEITTARRTGLEAELEAMKLTIEENARRTHLLDSLNQTLVGKPDSATVSLSETIVDFSVSNELAQKSAEIRQSLNDFFALPAMTELCRIKNIDCSAWPTRLTDNKVQAFIDESWVDLTDAVKQQPSLTGKLNELIEAAKTAGNAIYSSTTFDLQQIIRFMGFDAPGNVGGVRNIVRWLTTVLPASPPLGNCAVELLAQSSSSASLAPADRKNIIELSRTLINDAGAIFDVLGGHLLAGRSVEDIRANADTLLETMLNTEESDAWGQQLIQAINWYGAAEGQTATVRQYQQLLFTALKLGVDADSPGRPGTVAGYDIYQADNMGRDLGKVRADLETYLMQHKGVSSQSAPLVAHVFLAGVAPEFLVPDVAQSITMGSANWMTLRLGVAIAETTSQGCTRAMTVEQLLEVGLLEPVTPEQRLLFQTVAVDMVVQWGLMSGIVRQRSDFAYSAEDYKRAAHLYARQTEELGNALRACTQPFQTRRALAVIELRKVFPGVSDAGLEAIKLWSTVFDAHTNLQASKGRTQGLIEVYMAGDLKVGDWWIPVLGIKADQLNDKIRRLPDLNPILDASVNSYFAEFKSGYISPGKLLIANLPLEDRQCLELGQVELFTLREETGKAQEFETAEQRMALRGTLGTLIRCEYGTNVSYFEFFPGLMKLIKRTDLPTNLTLGGAIKTESMRMLGGSSNVDVQRGTDLPFDFEAYRTGAAPRPGHTSSKLIIERLGDVFPTQDLVGYDDPTAYVPNTYFSTRTTRIVTRVISDNFLQGQREFLYNSAKGTTTREESQAYWENIGNYLLQLIPFVGCVKDLTSGTRMGLINGAFGCFTDTVSSLSGMLGGAGKALRVLKSAAPVKLKAFEAFTITVSSAVSVINPLSGLPDLIVGGAVGVRRFGSMLASQVFRLTDNGVARLQAGMDQLRCFFGGFAANAGNINLPKRVNTLGAPVNGIYRNANFTAIQSNGNWYALDRGGDPYGQPLVEFKLSGATEATTQV